MDYDHKQALADLLGQIAAMKCRSEKYEAEEKAEGRIEEAEKHMRVFCVLKELERLGRAFEDRATMPGSPIAPAALAVGALAGEYERLRAALIELEDMSRDRLQAILANVKDEPRPRPAHQAAQPRLCRTWALALATCSTTLGERRRTVAKTEPRVRKPETSFGFAEE